MYSIDNIDQLGPPNAATKVFSTFELLENILVLVSKANLPHSDENHISRAQKLRLLYPLQRINKTSRNVINRSKTLRGHMFKEINDNADIPELKPIWRCAERILNPFAVVMYRLVPLGHLSFHITSVGSDMIYLQGRVATRNGSISLEEAKQLPSSASWREMLISCKSVGFLVRFNAQLHGGVIVRFHDLKLENEATLGDLADLIISMADTEDKEERKWAEKR